MKPGALEDERPVQGAQTLLRGLDVMDVVAARPISLPDLAEAVGLTRSTAYRLATALVDRRLLNFEPRMGYSLGPKLMELGHLASRQMSLPRVAHDFLVALSGKTGDTAHLGVLEGDHVLYLDKVPGSRRIEVSSRIGERQPLRSTGLGKALLLDKPRASLAALYESEGQRFPRYGVPLDDWLARMKEYGTAGYALDLAENEDNIRCVAAPARDASGNIIAAISVTSAAQYMDHDRMLALTSEVMATATAISAEFGWNPHAVKLARK